MNPDVALRAVLVKRTGHVMGRRRLGLDAVPLTPQVAGAIMAFQAQRKYHRPRQHPGIGGAVRNVTGEAPIHADWGVLKNKRPAFVGMTVDARFFVGLGLLHISRPRRVSPGGLKRSVWIVAIRAVHETFVDAVLEGQGKLRAHVSVAAVAQIRLGLGQEILGRRGAVNGMAVGAHDAIDGV